MCDNVLFSILLQHFSESTQLQETNLNRNNALVFAPADAPRSDHIGICQMPGHKLVFLGLTASNGNFVMQIVNHANACVVVTVGLMMTPGGNITRVLESRATRVLAGHQHIDNRWQNVATMWLDI